MAEYGKILASIDIEGNMDIYYAVAKLYQAMGRNEVRQGEDPVKMAIYIRDNIDRWIEILEKDVFPNEYGDLVYEANTA